MSKLAVAGAEHACTLDRVTVCAPSITLSHPKYLAEQALVLAFHIAADRGSPQHGSIEAGKPTAAVVRPDSPVQGIDALLPVFPRQVHEGAAVRIQRWYRHRQAERKVSHLCLPYHIPAAPTGFF